MRCPSPKCLKHITQGGRRSRVPHAADERATPHAHRVMAALVAAIHGLTQTPTDPVEKMDARNESGHDVARVYRVLPMISEPEHVDQVYVTLPKEALDAIHKRDNKT